MEMEIAITFIMSIFGFCMGMIFGLWAIMEEAKKEN